METTFVNKVVESGIISLDLANYLPTQPIALFDLKDHLFMGLILKEKDFRAALLTIDFSIYNNKHVGILCSADAIIPMWAYMLAVSYIQPHALSIQFGNEEAVQEKLLLHNFNTQFIAVDYLDKRVVVKGCGEVAIPPSAFIAITNVLRPYAKSIMYGEPCSTVPIYKKKA